MSRFYILTSLTLVLFFFGCTERGGRPGLPAGEPNSQQSEEVRNQNTSSHDGELKASAGGFEFTLFDGFDGPLEKGVFRHSKLRISINPAFKPGASFEETIKEFYDDTLLTQSKISPGERLDKEIAGRRTFLFKADRIGGKYPQAILTVVYPTKSGVAQITSIYPKDTPAEIQQQIESSLLMSKYTD
jgi:hypothetical protein